jgi:hypothetical protein
VLLQSATALEIDNVLPWSTVALIAAILTVAGIAVYAVFWRVCMHLFGRRKHPPA